MRLVLLSSIFYVDIYYIKNMVIIILFIILIFFKYTSKSLSWKPKYYFKEAEYFYNNRYIFKKELEKVLNDNWSIWSYDYTKTPIFTLMSHNDIKDKLDNSNSKIGSTKDPSWRLYGLILNKQILDTSKKCPETLKILNKYSDKILNAGFSLMEPGSHLGKHQDFNNTFFRLHIPILIPKNNNIKNKIFVSKSEALNEKLAVLQVENDYRIWRDDDYFIFDDTYMHDAWNNTDELRIVLLIDILK